MAGFGLGRSQLARPWAAPRARGAGVSSVQKLTNGPGPVRSARGRRAAAVAWAGERRDQRHQVHRACGGCAAHRPPGYQPAGLTPPHCFLRRGRHHRAGDGRGCPGNTLTGLVLYVRQDQRGERLRPLHGGRVPSATRRTGTPPATVGAREGPRRPELVIVALGRLAGHRPRRSKLTGGPRHPERPSYQRRSAGRPKAQFRRWFVGRWARRRAGRRRRPKAVSTDTACSPVGVKRPPSAHDLVAAAPARRRRRAAVALPARAQVEGVSGRSGGAHPPPVARVATFRPPARTPIALRAEALEWAAAAGLRQCAGCAQPRLRSFAHLLPRQRGRRCTASASKIAAPACTEPASGVRRRRAGWRRKAASTARHRPVDHREASRTASPRVPGGGARLRADGRCTR